MPHNSVSHSVNSESDGKQFFIGNFLPEPCILHGSVDLTIHFRLQAFEFFFDLMWVQIDLSIERTRRLFGIRHGIPLT